MCQKLTKNWVPHTWNSDKFQQILSLECGIALDQSIEAITWSKPSSIRRYKTASEVEVAWNFCYERPGLYPRAGDITEVLSVVEFGKYFIDQSGVYDKKFQVIMELDLRTDVPTKIGFKA